MVDITPRPAADRQVVQRYGGGGFRISGQHYEGAVLILPARTLIWQVSGFEALSADDFRPLRLERPAVELLVLGTGGGLRRLPRALAAEIREWGIAVEPMDTGAACRTYNVLLLEDRRVAAALLPIE
jgi:uncharacterized protein